MHVPGFVALQETPGEFLALLGEAPAFQGLPKVVELTRSRAQKILHPSTAQADGDEAAAAAATEDGDKADAAAADAMQQDGEGQGGDADAAADGGDAAQQQGEESGAMDVDKAADGQQQQPDGEGQQQPAEQQDPVAAWSGRLQGVLQARFNLEHKPFTLDQVLLWMEQEQVRTVTGEMHHPAKSALDSMHAAGCTQ
jgi:hypothetical protein